MEKKQLNNEEISLFCMELSLLLRAGIGVGEGLYLLAEDSKDRRLSAMAEAVEQGTPLASAMTESGLFPVYVCGLAEVGEQTGRLEEALHSLAVYYDNREQLSSRVRSALVYPAVLFAVMLAVVVVLLVKVLPVFDDIYASLGGELTGVAGGLLRLGELLGAAMPLLCAVLFVVAALVLAFAVSLSFREKVLALWNRICGDRGVSRQLSSARYVQALAMGLRSGLDAEETVTLAGQLEKDSAGQARYDAVLTALQQEGDLAKALAAGEVMSPSFLRMLTLAQRSGSTDEVMDEIARRLERSAEESLEKKVSQVEPALVVVMSLLVGVILLSVMLPLMNIMSAIG